MSSLKNNPKDESNIFILEVNILRYDRIIQFINRSCEHRIKELNEEAVFEINNMVMKDISLCILRRI
jgi:hypothetical protein